MSANAKWQPDAKDWAPIEKDLASFSPAYISVDVISPDVTISLRAKTDPTQEITVAGPQVFRRLKIPKLTAPPNVADKVKFKTCGVAWLSWPQTDLACETIYLNPKIYHCDLIIGQSALKQLRITDSDGNRRQ